MALMDHINFLHGTIVLGALIAFFVVLRKRPLNPVIWFYLLFSFYFSSANLGNRSLIFPSGDELEYLLYGILLIISFSIGALLCSLIMSRNGPLPIHLNNAYELKPYLYSAIIVMLIFSPLLLIEMIYAVKAWGAGMNYGETRSYVLSHRLVSNPGLIISLCLTFFYVVSKRKWPLLVFSVIILFFLMIGERRDAAIAILAFIFFYYAVEPWRQSKRFLPAVIIILMMLATAYGHIRSVLFSDITEVPVRFLEQTSENPVGLLMPLDSGEFFNIAAVSKSGYILFDGEYNFGANYVSAVYSIMPIIGRWPLMDTLPSAERLSDKYGESLVRQGLIGGTGGVAFGIDAYFAFGSIGAGVIFLIFGFSLFFFYRRALRSNIFVRFAYASALPIIVLHAGRSSIESVVPNLIKINLLPFISILMIGLFLKLLKSDSVEKKT